MEVFISIFISIPSFRYQYIAVQPFQGWWDPYHLSRPGVLPRVTDIEAL